LSLFAWFAGDIASVWKIFWGKYSCDGNLGGRDGIQEGKRKVFFLLLLFRIGAAMACGRYGGILLHSMGSCIPTVHIT
jgi:hypothetical protein